MLKNCSCGACCEECGHELGCIRFADERAVPLAEAIASPPAGSFLDYLIGRGVVTTGGAA